MLARFTALIGYIKARFNEASTYAGIGAAIAGANALSHPWDYVTVVVGSLGVIIPTKKGSKGPKGADADTTS